MHVLSVLALLAYGVPLVLAGWTDFTSYRIPNLVSGALAFLYPLAAFLLGHMAAIPGHLLVAGAVLAVGLPLFALRVMGGGDVKLLSAAALWLGPVGIADFACLTAILGGFYSLAVVVARSVTKSEARRIPYGVPIAAAALMLGQTILLSQ